jgi:SAM-dependent methyltransferase
MTDHKAIFSTVEFGSWAFRNRLIPAEHLLIERYLVKGGRTLEAGTGGGKILFAMRDLGFTNLYGFDFVPEFIEQAKKRDTQGDINFEVGDAAQLSFGDGFFDQIIYLQQILSLIEGKSAILNVLQEAHRVLRPGGTGLFSFLSYDVRTQNIRYRPYLTYLRLLRLIGRSDRTVQQIPWLKLGGKFNPGALVDRGPYCYWYRRQEICDILKTVGFTVTAIGSTRQIEQGSLCNDLDKLEREPITGMMYVVCKK